ncbi:DUF222 domain-containing protein [Cellulomonas fimi]|uniref:HNH endonuclease signature motif containing protein n=1 Tax=Cellulomonas fimi TaxID=1708 RepID=UPI0028933938|nr:DUF222 domain-containing protein [Cellulomonas fimi]
MFETAAPARDGSTPSRPGPSTSGIDLVFTQMMATVTPAAAHSVPSGSVVRAAAPSGVELASALDGAAPGVDLVEVLGSLVPADLHDAALVEAIAGWERIASWAAAQQARLIVELGRRREIGRLGEYVADEVALRLSTTRAVAERKVGLATCLDAMPEVHDALRSGEIDVRKAVALVDATEHLPIEEARRAAVLVLPDARDLTVPQLRARLRRLDLTRDVGAARRREARAVDQRHVTLSPAPDSMAWINAYLPAVDAMRVFTALDALAGTAAADDRRGIDARRADALSDTFARILDGGQAPGGGALVTRHRRRPHLHVTAAATTLLGLDEAPAELAGYGPIPAATARALAADATWRRIFTDPATGQLTGIGPRAYRAGADLTATVIARDVTCTFPGCRTPSFRCDLDHVEPFDPDSPGEHQTTCDNLHALCRHHHRLKTHGGWTVTRQPSTGATDWTAPTGHRYRRPTIPADGTPPRQPGIGGEPPGSGFVRNDTERPPPF